MKKDIIIYSDSVCPFCLLAHKVIEKATKNIDIKISWKPFELRPYPIPTLRVEDEYLPEIWKRAVYPMAESLNVPILLPSISPQPRTAKAFEAFIYAEEYNLGNKFNEKVFEAFFQKNLDIGNINILAELGDEIGLNKNELKNALQTNKYSEAHSKALQHANDMKITAAPTVIIGDEIYQGCPTQDWVENAIKLLDKKRKCINV